MTVDGLCPPSGCRKVISTGGFSNISMYRLVKGMVTSVTERAARKSSQITSGGKLALTSAFCERKLSHRPSF